ncbi:protein-glutamate O-methyltransferase CheR [Tepidibacillus marianensis]|uniref:CheR family methyltransferase n=1 Tax=Tepidibacillus marianensis TaxID=3131995 RepID=UPI0030CE1180
MTSIDQDYQTFVSNIRKKTGIDLNLYKEQQMKRRLNSLRMKRGFANFVEYFKAIEKEEIIYLELLDRITINVSEFFRNRPRWIILENKILPQLLQSRALKAWSAACSTGEEPFTLAMIIQQKYPHARLDLVATDIDEGALKKANEGIYHERSIQEVPKEYLQSYFQLNHNLYHVSDQIKNKVKFRKHNLLLDPFEKQYDLIICRNVMIYFTEEAKNQLYLKFSQALRPGGILFVGSTEQIFNPVQYQLEPVETFFIGK